MRAKYENSKQQSTKLKNILIKKENMLKQELDNKELMFMQLAKKEKECDEIQIKINSFKNNKNPEKIEENKILNENKNNKNENKEKEKEKEEKDIVVVNKNPEANQFMTPVKPEEENNEIKNKNSLKKNLDKYEKDDMLEKIKKMTAEKNPQKIKNQNEQKEQIENKENINSQKNTEKKSPKKEKEKEKPKKDNQNNQKKKISPEMIYNIPIITCSNEKK